MEAQEIINTCEDPIRNFRTYQTHMAGLISDAIKEWKRQNE